jgi:hypothetical protein
MFFGGGEMFDGEEGIDKGSGKLVGPLQDFREGLGVEFKIGIGQAVFREEVGEAGEELGEKPAVDVAEDGGIGEESQGHGFTI